jgi:predicted porin
MAGVTLHADVIASEDNRTDEEKRIQEERSNGTSLSATYETGGFYGALAYDLDVEAEGTSTVRGVLQYTIADVQLGLLAEEYEPAEKDADKVNGVLGSIKYTISDWALLAQYGQSDIYKTDGTTLSLGVDYLLSKNAKLFGVYTNNAYVTKNLVKGTEVDTDMDYLGVGMELKF